MSQKELKQTINKIITELKNKYSLIDITYADIGDYISEECEIQITSEIATKIIQICHDKIREAEDISDLPIAKDGKLTETFIAAISKY